MNSSETMERIIYALLKEQGKDSITIDNSVVPDEISMNITHNYMNKTYTINLNEEEIDISNICENVLIELIRSTCREKPVLKLSNINSGKYVVKAVKDTTKDTLTLSLIDA